MQGPSPARITLIALAASAGAQMPGNAELVLEGVTMTAEEAEKQLMSLPKPLACAAIMAEQKLSVSCSSPTSGELIMVAERAKLTQQGLGVVGAILHLPEGIRLILRGAGLEVEVNRAALLEWAASYHFQSPLAIGVERQGTGPTETHVISLSSLRSVPHEELSRAVRRDSSQDQ